MSTLVRIGALGLALGIGVIAAPQNASFQFDAASVKPATPNLPGGRIGAVPPVGGPGTSDPGRISYRAVSLKSLLMRAFDVVNFEIIGPGWLDTDIFELTATIPPNTTDEQFRAMLQNLLVDRFQMKMHRETRELSGYSLGVAKNGPKFKPSGVSTIHNADAADSPLKLGADGFFVPPQRPGMFLQMTGTQAARATFHEASMRMLAETLQSQLQRPVTDDTGLRGSYDFVLSFSREGLDFGRLRIPVSPGDGELQPEISAALPLQLGLQFEPKKASVPVIVVDQIEKTVKDN